jgi:hypothetical protein
MASWWESLGDPALTAELRQRLAQGIAEEAPGAASPSWKPGATSSWSICWRSRRRGNSGLPRIGYSAGVVAGSCNVSISAAGTSAPGWGRRLRITTAELRFGGGNHEYFSWVRLLRPARNGETIAVADSRSRGMSVKENP